jgi:hypothetical protein
MEGLFGFVDAGYLSDPHNGHSQTGYAFMCGGASISWHSMKQTIAATSSNHADISYSQSMQFTFRKGSANGYT